MKPKCLILSTISAIKKKNLQTSQRTTHSSAPTAQVSQSGRDIHMVTYDEHPLKKSLFSSNESLLKVLGVTGVPAM